MSQVVNSMSLAVEQEAAKQARIAKVRAGRSLSPEHEAHAQTLDDFLDAVQNPAPQNGLEGCWISGRPPEKPGSKPAA